MIRCWNRRTYDFLIRERERGGGSTVNRLLTKSVSLKGNLFAQCLNGAIRRSCRTLYTYTSRGCEQTSERGWWPLSCRADKKFSFKTVGRDTTLCCRRGTLQTRGQAQWRGACVLLVCALFTQPASPPWDRENPLFLFPLPAPPRVVHPSRMDAKPTHCGTPRANRTTILLWKSETFALSLSFPSTMNDIFFFLGTERSRALEWNREIVVQVYTRFFIFRRRGNTVGMNNNTN